MVGNRQVRKFLSIGLLFLMITLSIGVLGTNVYADESSVNLDMDDTNLQVGVSTTLTLTIINMNGAKLKSIDGLDNFDVLSRSQSTSTQIINNSTSTQIQLNYELMPKAVGDYQLTAYVEYQGKTYTTNTLDIHATEKSTSSDEDTSDLFVKTILSKDSAYFGQKLVLTYELYSRYNIQDYGFVNDVKLDGFITEDLPTDQLQAKYVTINGNKYVKYEVKKIILTPIAPGTIKIPAYNFQVNVSTGDFFNSSQAFYLNTDEKELVIKSLPTEQQPKNFTGLVGQLDVQSDYSGDEIDYGGSLTLHVTLSGDCNIDVLDTLDTNTLTNFTKYETQKDLKEDTSGNSYHAQKEFDIILVPQVTGKINIDPIKINYFDDIDNTYKEKIIPGKTIQVNGTIPEVSNNIQNTSSSENPEPILINQINPGQIDNSCFVIKKTDLYKVLVIILIMVIGIIITFFIYKKQSRKDKNLQQMIRRIKKTNDLNTAYDILNEMVKYRYNISLKASSRFEIQNKITNNELVKALFEIMDYVELQFRKESRNEFDFKKKISKIIKEINNIK